MGKMQEFWRVDRHFFFRDWWNPSWNWGLAFHGQPLTSMHQGMFTYALNAYSTDEQKAKWHTACTNFDIWGCYAQTELGHGSNVQGLETTAVFDQATDEFVLNTPTITSTKWWPGELGRYANHALIMARLQINSDGHMNDYGVCPFIVQIRDMDTHKHMAGIKCGDLGPKLGYHSKDNGWLTMKDVRIPRD